MDEPINVFFMIALSFPPSVAHHEKPAILVFAIPPGDLNILAVISGHKLTKPRIFRKLGE